MYVFAGNVSPKDLYSFRSLSMMRPQLTPLAVKPSVAKYTEKDLQRILRTVLKAWAPSDGAHEKLLNARLPDVYCSKSHMECYNFCQQCEDHFATAGALAPTVFFLQHFSCVTASTSVGSNISGNMRPRAQFLSLKRSSRPSFAEA